MSMNITERTPAERVRIARMESRPTTEEYIKAIFTDWMPMAGDRNCGEDEAIIGGIARLGAEPVTVIGHQKGRSLEENLKRRFGMPNPEGYRKAQRLMKQADKFHRPIITFVDTPGAYPGKEAEERGQGNAIAECLKTMSRVSVPVISVFIGEGGSGGALAIGVCDRMIMLENSVYSILSPEGFASILWKDGTRWEEASAVMRMTAPELQRMKVCDVIIPEPGEGAHESRDYVFARVEQELMDALHDLNRIRRKDIAETRYRRIRSTGRELIKNNIWHEDSDRKTNGKTDGKSTVEYGEEAKRE